MQNDIAGLQAQLRRLRAITGLLFTVVIAGLVLSIAAARSPTTRIIRARGLIIEDAAGRARILLGAPAPEVPERVRTDRDKVLAAWGERYGHQMDWYFENVSNDVYGMVILSERGHDRITLGSPTADPNIGARIEPSHGMQLNDAEGFEVGGFGYFDERKMTGLGMDNADGEGLYLLATSDGTSGMIVNDHAGKRRLFVGHATTDSGLSPGPELLGASIADGAGESWWVLNTGTGFGPFTPPAESTEPPATPERP